MTGPDKHTLFPLDGYQRLCFLKNLVKNPNILVGDYTYYDDFDSVDNFERNVLYHFPFTGDKLILGKFCMIASGVQFIMNGANHLTESVSAYPFAIFGHGWEAAMEGRQYPNKGNIVIGHDVWIGYKATILAGVHVGDGAIIASHALVTRDVAPYTIVGGNPAEVIRKRFSPEAIQRLLAIQWWHWDQEKVTRNIRLLTGTDLDALEQAT